MEGLRWILLLLGVALVAAVYWSGRRAPGEPRESLYERARRAVEREEAARQPEPEPEATSATPEVEPDVGIESQEGLPTVDEPGAESAAPAVEAVATAAPGSEPGADEPAETEGRGATAGAPGAAAESEGGPDTAAPETASARAAPAPEPGGSERPEASSGAAEHMVVLFLVAAEGERLVGAQLAEAFARHGLEHGEQQIFHARDGEGGTVFSVANAIEPGTFDPATMDTLSTPGLALVLRLPGPQSAETAFDRMVTTARALADELGARVLDGSRSTLTRQTEQHLREELRAFDLRRSRGPL